MRKLHGLMLISSVMTTFSYAQNIPTNSLQAEYQQSININALLDTTLTSVYQIPASTYTYLNQTFRHFYKSLTYETSITDSTFGEHHYSELLSVPLISSDHQFFQLEIFGELSDPNTEYYNNMTADHAMYEYVSNSEIFDLYNAEISLGAAVSFQTSPSSKVKVLFSNKKLPGYGDSQALIGFESAF